MKILFTGGGTGGHFYPIIAVAQEIKRLAEEGKLVSPKLFYMATEPYSKQLLFEEGIDFVPISAGKWRRYFSLQNYFDLFKTAWGIVQSLAKLYLIYPDVIFSKGGYASFPPLVAARFLRIPVIVHESDSHPGRVNLWAGKFANAIAVSYPEATKYFPPNKTAVTGNPIRRELLTKLGDGAFEFLKLDPKLPVIFVVGGSQGAMIINDALLDILPDLLSKYQVIHQTGKDNFESIKSRTDFILENNPHKTRYLPYNYLNETAMRMVAAVTTLVISRAGSAIFEFANWELPAILIPIPETISHDQRTNAYTYSRSGGAVVMEEANLKPSVMLLEIERLINNPEMLAKMRAGAKSFSRADAGETIARHILTIALEHEK